MAVEERPEAGAAEVVPVAGMGTAMAPTGRRVKAGLTAFAGARRTGANASAADHPVASPKRTRVA